MEDCLFCKFVSGEIAPDVVYQDDLVLAFRDINPQAPTHVLIVPKQHTKDASTVEPSDGPALAAITNAARTIAAQEGLPGGYRLVANVGPDAGQSVFHLHVHMLGGRSLAWPPG
ncbi:MAG TPA: histidine triad nucleotide-binding protein [Actinomycetota bacterium]|nr:histidine triad nucleotide-binding protein [Actinomycetota bacterium]